LANIASVLKEEIARVARKELRSETDSLKKASGRYRSEIAALKRRVADLEQQLSRMERMLGRSAAATPKPEGATTANGARFSAPGLKKHRERLELSAPTLASILGVSAQTIYNWEAGTTRPNPQQIANIAILRKMGKREVQARLKQSAGA
jgi:DNA-binding transcriptional regulator YiaG